MSPQLTLVLSQLSGIIPKPASLGAFSGKKSLILNPPNLEIWLGICQPAVNFWSLHISQKEFFWRVPTSHSHRKPKVQNLTLQWKTSPVPVRHSQLPWDLTEKKKHGAQTVHDLSAGFLLVSLISPKFGDLRHNEFTGGIFL